MLDKKNPGKAFVAAISAKPGFYWVQNMHMFIYQVQTFNLYSNLNTEPHLMGKGSNFKNKVLYYIIEVV